MNKTFRRILALVLVLASSIAIAMFLRSKKEPPRKKPDAVVQNLVEVVAFSPSTEKVIIHVDGRIRAKNRIDIYSEVTGKLVSGARPFKEGNMFRRGQVLLRLDDTDARMNAVAQRSTFQSRLTLLLADIKIDHPEEFDQWNTYVVSMDPTTDLAPLPEVSDSHLKSFLVSNGIYQLFYQIRAAEAQLRKYSVVAPFTGVLFTANVTEGEVIRAGQPVGVFLQTDSYELEFGVRLPEREKISIGDNVTLSAAEKPGKWEGKVARISEAIDPGTQTVKIYLDVEGKNLYDGMYLSGELIAGTAENVMRYPANLITSEETVFVVNDTMLQEKKVDVVHREVNTVLISGLPGNSLLISSPVSGAHDGMVVQVKQN